MKIKMEVKPSLYVVVAFFVANTLSACMGDKKVMADDAKEEIVRPALIAEVEGFEGSGVRSFPALIEANKKSDLAFRVAGQLIKLPIQAGTEVKKGQLLAQIDSTDYKNAYDDRVAKLSLAKTQHKQTITLFKKSYASQAEVDTVNAQLKAAQVAVKQAKTNLTYTSLRAPFTGSISHVNVENHQFIQPQQTIVKLQNTQQLDVRFDVPEALIKGLKSGDEYKSLCGTIRLNSDDTKQFKACYKEHDSVPDAATRSYPVLFSLKNPEDSNVLPGMSVDIEIDLGALALTTEEGLLIPVESVFDEGNEQWVWTVTNELRVKKTKVTVSGINNDKVRISNGLVAGDKVIAAGVSYLSEGQKVRPLDKERGL